MRVTSVKTTGKVFHVVTCYLSHSLAGSLRTSWVLGKISKRWIDRRQNSQCSKPLPLAPSLSDRLQWWQTPLAWFMCLKGVCVGDWCAGQSVVCPGRCKAQAFLIGLPTLCGPGWNPHLLAWGWPKGCLAGGVGSCIPSGQSFYLFSSNELPQCFKKGSPHPHILSCCTHPFCSLHWGWPCGRCKDLAVGRGTLRKQVERHL